MMLTSYTFNDIHTVFEEGILNAPFMMAGWPRYSYTLDEDGLQDIYN